MNKNGMKKNRGIYTGLKLSILIIALSGLVAPTSSQQWAVSARQEGKGRSVKRVRITADDIARLPRGKTYLVDLSHGGTIYDFNSTSRRIDFSRINVRTAAGDFAMAAWLKKLLPRTTGSKWMSGRIRVGAANDFSDPNVRQPRPSGSVKYTCDASHCECSGYYDCISMFNDEKACGGGNAVCHDDNPDRPQCRCDRP